MGLSVRKYFAGNFAHGKNVTFWYVLVGRQNSVDVSGEAIKFRKRRNIVVAASV